LLKVELDDKQGELDAASAEVDRLKGDLRDFIIDQYTAQTDEYTFFSMADINQALVQQSLAGVLADRKGSAIEH
jgi:hypothetical protein